MITWDLLPPFTSWDQVPLVPEVEDIGRLIRVTSYDAVRRAIKSKQVPEPFMSNPMRWSKADLQRHFHFPLTAAAHRAPMEKAS